MSSDAEVTVIGHGGVAPAGTGATDPDPVTRLTRLGTASCVMILDQVLRSAAADGAEDVAALARRMTRATRDFRAAAAELSDRR